MARLHCGDAPPPSLTSVHGARAPALQPLRKTPLRVGIAKLGGVEVLVARARQVVPARGAHGLGVHMACVQVLCSARVVYGRMLKSSTARAHARAHAKRTRRAAKVLRGDDQATARLSSSRRAALALAQAWPVAAACRCQ